MDPQAILEVLPESHPAKAEYKANIERITKRVGHYPTPATCAIVAIAAVTHGALMDSVGAGDGDGAVAAMRMLLSGVASYAATAERTLSATSAPKQHTFGFDTARIQREN